MAAGPPAQRLLQGVRKGEVLYPSGYTAHTNVTEAKVTLRDFGFSATPSERIELSLRTQCAVDLSSLSEAFRTDWMMVSLSIQSSGAEERSLLEIPPYANTMASVTVDGLTLQTAQKTRTQYEKYNGRHISIRDDIVYTACFIKRQSETPLLCLSLTNNNNVAFIFPFEAKSAPCILWANKQILAEASTYFASMFSGAFEESQRPMVEASKLMASVRQDIADAIAVERGKGMKEAAPVEDSDDEDGNEEQRTALWEKLDRQRNASPSDISYVVIRETPYKTYRALFQWLLTREVPTFASIRSALLVSDYLDTNPSPK